MCVVSDSQKSFRGPGEICSGSSLALEASVQRASPAHRVLADGIAQKEVSVNAEVIATLSLKVFRRIDFAIGRFLNLAIRIEVCQ